MGSRLKEQFPFLVASALIAAGIADPLVEALAGAGIFGPGYADHNHLGVIPALLAAVAVLGAAFAIACYRGRYLARRDRGPAVRPIGVSDLTAIVPLQFAAIFGMESLEAALVGQPLQAGLGWLGGPVPWSVAIDVLVAVCALVLVRRFMHAMPHACAIIVRALAALDHRSSPRTGRKGRVYDVARSSLHSGALLARRIGARAPPLFPIPA